MTTLRARDRPPDLDVERVLGDVRGRRPGPTLVVVTGLHGNEPAGVEAARRVLTRLEPDRLRGRVLALAGNLGALARGERYLDRDLNRSWRPAQVERLRRDGPDPAVREEAEQRALLQELHAAFAAAENVFLLDLHTTSGRGPPFATFGDTLRNRAFARALPVPMVLGLEEQVGGTLLEYADGLGHTGIAVEGGRHDDPRSVDHLIAALTLALGAAGLVSRGARPLRDAHHLLSTAAAGLPEVVEIRYRHPVAPRDGFRMRPGYASFVAVRTGEVVARNATGDVRIREAGRILMPRYQARGDDGYFLVREVRPAWLTLSTLLRRLRLDRLAPLLPGVHRHPNRRDAVVVDLRVARWRTVDLFHLLGYRRRRRVRQTLVLTRRRLDR